tara:strand:- start:1361 stop:1765 length:405 start_codon:yes stop_codon:yes gene_type:complete
MPKKSAKNSKSSKTAKSSKNKLQNLEQSHGKDESKPVPMTLNQIWGDDGLSEYGTLDLESYTQRIKTYTWSDLREEAAKRDIVPIGDRTQIEAKLINKFKNYKSTFTVEGTTSDTSQEQEGLTDEIKNILREGR